MPLSYDRAMGYGLYVWQYASVPYPLHEAAATATAAVAVAAVAAASADVAAAASADSAAAKVVCAV